MHRREQQHEDAEGRRPDREESPARLAESRRGERANERSEAERRRQQAEPLRSDVQRVRGEQRYEDVEVEADGRDDRDHAEDEPELAVVQAYANARRIPSITRADGSRTIGRSSSSRTSASAVSTARKLTAFRAKQMPVPTVAISSPAIAGRSHASR